MVHSENHDLQASLWSNSPPHLQWAVWHTVGHTLIRIHDHPAVIDRSQFRQSRMPATHPVPILTGATRFASGLQAASSQDSIRRRRGHRSVASVTTDGHVRERFSKGASAKTNPSNLRKDLVEAWKRTAKESYGKLAISASNCRLDVTSGSSAD